MVEEGLRFELGFELTVLVEVFSMVDEEEDFLLLVVVDDEEEESIWVVEGAFVVTIVVVVDGDFVVVDNLFAGEDVDDGFSADEEVEATFKEEVVLEAEEDEDNLIELRVLAIVEDEGFVEETALEEVREKVVEGVEGDV